MFLVIVDAFSKWPEVFQMNSCTATATINKLKELFSIFGLPELLVSDNGTQFKAAAFETFCKQGGIKHVRTPPYHPQSNGQAEKFVDIFKLGMLKLENEELITSALQTVLLSYRTTPNRQLPNNITPAEAMLGRKIKIQLDLLRGSPNSFSNFERDEKMESQYNRKHGTKQRQFYPNDPVFAMNYSESRRTWIPAIILQKIDTVMYAVQAGNRTWRRHQNQLRPRYAGQNQNSVKLEDVFLFDPPELPTGDVKPPEEAEEDPDTAPKASSDTPNVIESSSSIRDRPQRIRVPPKRLTCSESVRGKYSYT